MKNPYIPILLLNLTQNEWKLLTSLFLLYEVEKHRSIGALDKNPIYKIKDISKLSGLSELKVVDSLNKLVIRNVVGKITYDNITNGRVIKNFDEDFLNKLYNKSNPLKSAIDRVGYSIEDIKDIYVLNTAEISWKYPPRSEIEKVLKFIDNKIAKDDLVVHLLNSLKNGKQSANTKINGWNLYGSVELFKDKYRIHYGNIYTGNEKLDFRHMKLLLEQLTINNLPKDRLGLFFDFAFDQAKSRDYVLNIVGLKYYVNEYLQRN